MDDDFLGIDLDLGFVADEEGRTFAGPYSALDLQAHERRDVVPRTQDIGRIRGRANLVQALIMRLKTAQGELADLGHPRYGSRHHRLVGEPNTENNRSLLKLYLIECLRQEPRLEQIEAINVLPGSGRENRDKVDVRIRVKMKGLPDALNLVVPFSFVETLA